MTHIFLKIVEYIFFAGIGMIVGFMAIALTLLLIIGVGYLLIMGAIGLMVWLKYDIFNPN